MSLRCAIAAAAAATVASTSLMLPMRDGVKLHTEYDEPPFFPAGKRVPAVLERSPYGANAEELIATVFAELLGYVGVRQDMRGTKQSEGNFSLWHDSAGDAYDTIDWIVAQPWCNGQVYTIGASADAIDEYMQLSAPHPAVRAQVAIFSSGKAWETFYVGGAYRQALIDGWLKDTVPTQYADLDAFVKSQEQPGTPWWQPVNLTNWYANVAFPSLHWAGWYDIFQSGNLDAYQGYLHDSASLPGQAKLVIDPLGHCQSGASFFSRDVAFGRVLLPVLIALDLMADDSVTNKTFPDVPEGVGNVTFYVMGSNENGAPGEYWTTMADVPVPTPTPLFLQPGGGLGPSPTAGPTSASYAYDPADPVPTIGGNNLLIPCGPLDQRPIEEARRQDVLIFTTPPLTQQVAVTGGLHATIYVSTDAVDTDVVVKLIDVYPASSPDPTLAGSSTLIADGIARLRWRDFPATNVPQLLSGNPADVVKVDVSLWNTSYVFAPGHSIRVHVTSSNFPRFTPNPNNGLPVDMLGANVTAHTTIHFDAAHPSAFILPVVDAATQLPEFPVEEATARALRPYEAAWRAGRIAAGEDGTEDMVEWVARRVGKVADASLRFGRAAAAQAAARRA